MSKLAASSLGHTPPIQATPEIDSSPLRRAKRALAVVAAGWWLTALAGQTVFTVYVAALYGVTSLHGDFPRWNDVMPRGWVSADVGGNLAVAVHLVFAAVVFASGALQLCAWVRRNAPRLHRWNGRFYLIAASVLATTGLVLVFTGRAPGDGSQHAGTVLNAALILVFGAMALRDAVSRRFSSHARWALRLLLAVAGVWFFRIGLMAWIVLNRGPAGFDPHAFRGPTLTALAFAQTLLPLAILEGVFRAKRDSSGASHWALTAVMVLATVLTLIGTAAATMLMWWPHMRA